MREIFIVAATAGLICASAQAYTPPTDEEIDLEVNTILNATQDRGASVLRLIYMAGFDKGATSPLITPLAGMQSANAIGELVLIQQKVATCNASADERESVAARLWSVGEYIAWVTDEVNKLHPVAPPQ